MLVPITSGAYLLTAGSTPQTIAPIEQIVIAIEEPTIEQIVRDATVKYGVSFDEVWKKMGCETQWTYDPAMQSKVKYNFSDARRGIVYGEREKSYGLAQIHLPDHPETTYEQATDPYYSADFIAKNWEKHSGWWYCKS